MLQSSYTQVFTTFVVSFISSTPFAGSSEPTSLHSSLSVCVLRTANCTWTHQCSKAMALVLMCKPLEQGFSRHILIVLCRTS